MDKTKLAFIFYGLFVFLTSCKQAISPEKQQPKLPVYTHYVSIDGLWRATPETATKYPHGILEPIIQVSGEASGKLNVRGCFFWDNHFYDYWEFEHVQFMDSTRQLVILDIDGGIYQGFVDNRKGQIRGTVCWGGDEDTLKLDFVRDENLDATQLFVPYPSGPTGSVKYTYQQPDDQKDQLQTASVFDFVDDSTAFYNLIERIIKQKHGRLESFLIIKDQKLVFEEYFYGYNRNQLHNIRSCTKSITSLLLGITLERHQKLNASQPFFRFFQEYDSLMTPEMEQITLKHVMTMTPGFTAEDDWEIHNPNDLVKELLLQPLQTAPGERFQYNNNCTNLLGCVIYTLEKEQADEFAKEVLFNRLGITDFYWEKVNGVLHCHSDLHLKPRDMAKIGLLVLNNGVWAGKQIVPKDWLTESTKPHVAESEFFDYGYQWWYRSKQNKSWWKEPVHGSCDEDDMFLALGYGGQYIMIIRDMNMVIVTTSSDFNEENGMAHQKIPMVIEEVVPLFKQKHQL